VVEARASNGLPIQTSILVVALDHFVKDEEPVVALVKAKASLAVGADDLFDDRPCGVRRKFRGFPNGSAHIPAALLSLSLEQPA